MGICISRLLLSRWGADHLRLNLSVTGPTGAHATPKWDCNALAVMETCMRLCLEVWSMCGECAQVQLATEVQSLEVLPADVAQGAHPLR